MKRRVGLFLRGLILGVVIGAGWGAVAGFAFLGVGGLLYGALNGAINVILLMAVIGGAEIFLPPTRLGYALERAPFLVTSAVKWLVYSAVILLVIGGRLGRRVAAPALLSRELAQALDQQTGRILLSIAFAFVVTSSFIVMLQMSRLIGERTLRDVVLGRYHRSRSEGRFFLFVDIAGSTPLAERIGPDAVHRFLGEVFRLASDPIDDHHGEVYQYVGARS